MRVWIDLANSPHALCFAPIAERLHQRGDTVLITVRRFAHTVELAKQRYSHPVVVGRGAAASLPQKTVQLGHRVLALRNVAREFGPDVAVSHGSYDQVVAARTLGVPSLVSVDYEYQPANHLSFRLATRLLLPADFEQRDIDWHGGRGKAWRYQGLKEELYLSHFQPSREVRDTLGLDTEARIIVAVRPPPLGALYHRRGNPIFKQVMTKLRDRNDVLTLVIARHADDVQPLIEEVEGGGVHVLRDVVDGPSLIWWADAMISGGGTMNREAVVLGTPVWTMFGGSLGAVDRRLIRLGLLRQLRSPEDLRSFLPVKRDPAAWRPMDHNLVSRFITAITETAGTK